MLFDSHAHLNNPDFQGIQDSEIEKAFNNGISALLNAGYDMETSLNAAAMALKHENVYASVGIHPHDAKDFLPDMLIRFEGILQEEKVVAVGEIGLDYCKEYSPRDVQRRVFETQLEFARTHHVPVIIHSRDACEDTYSILKNGNHYNGVLHCYSGSAEQAMKYCELGFYISLAGPVTFKNAKKPVSVAAAVSLDRLLVETDCPYLAPVPHRGEKNYPHYVRYIAEKIAEIKGLSFEEVAQKTFDNTVRCFGIHG